MSHNFHSSDKLETNQGLAERLHALIITRFSVYTVRLAR